MTKSSIARVTDASEIKKSLREKPNDYKIQRPFAEATRLMN